MVLTVTIPDESVADLQAFMAKRLLKLYPGWDTSAEDVLQVMLDDFAADSCYEAPIHTKRWAMDEATTPAELATATGEENDALNAKIAFEATRLAARV